MKVLVDTCIWSSALRKHRKQQALSEEVILLKRLIQQNRAVMIGAIYQEVLTGIKDIEQFKKLKELLEPFALLKIDREDYSYAASLFNLCRSNGVQGAHTDYLICAAAIKYQIPILTSDNDFKHYKKYMPLKLFLDGQL